MFVSATQPNHLICKLPTITSACTGRHRRFLRSSCRNCSNCVGSFLTSSSPSLLTDDASWFVSIRACTKEIAPAARTGQPPALLEGQARMGNADSPANLSPKLANEPLVRTAVQELGATTRALYLSLDEAVRRAARLVDPSAGREYNIFRLRGRG